MTSTKQSTSELAQDIAGCISEEQEYALIELLDEIVYDLTQEDEGIPMGSVDESDADEVSLRRSQWASNINNGGLTSQLEYILNAGFLGGAMTYLRAYCDSNHHRLRLEALAQASGQV